MPSPEPTILTKWGRLTGAQWLEARYQHELAEWLTDEALHYIFTRTPYHRIEYNQHGKEVRVEIIDWEFRRLLEDDPEAAQAQLLEERAAFYADLEVRRTRRKQEESFLDDAKSDYVKRMARAGRHRRARPGSDSRSRSTAPTQLAIL